MAVDEPSRVVEERNSSRNWSPAVRPVGMRPQSAGTKKSAVVASSTLEGVPVPLVLMAETR